MSYTLKGIGQNAMQAMQSFTSAISAGKSALDQLRTGMAEGVVRGQFGPRCRASSGR